MKKNVSLWSLALISSLCLNIACGNAQDHDDEIDVRTEKLPSQWLPIYANNILSVARTTNERCSFTPPDYYQCEDISQGTAFVIANNLVVTNYHVIDKYFMVKSTETEKTFHQIYLRYPATKDLDYNYFLPGRYYVTGIYPLANRDLALLKVDTLGNQPIPLDNQGFYSLDPGKITMLIGFPSANEFIGALGQINKLFLNNGQANWIATGTPLIEITAATGPGSSGSPVFNDNGKAIGVLTGGNDRYSIAFSVDLILELNWQTLNFQTNGLEIYYH